MRKIYEDRLLALATYLREEVPDDHFRMGRWGSGPHPECGTGACAAGWATNIFQELKLIQLRGEKTWYFYYERNFGYAAIERFFGLTYPAAVHLFGPNGEPNRHKVAKQIEEFVLRESTS